jgi:methionyl-tRNA synthetase
MALESTSTKQESQSSSPEQHNILVCVAWPYANGNLHLGHLAGSLLGPDIFARYHRAMGNKVLMVSGSDEHGTPIAVRAQAEGKTPKEIVDFYRAQTLQDLDKLGIQFDLFFRTSHPNHKTVVHDIFLDLLAKGHIHPKTTTEAYCPSCSKFLPDRFIEGTCPHCESPGARGDQCDNCGKPLDFSELVNPRCKSCGATPEPRETDHYFLKLGNFQDQLQTFVGEKKNMKRSVLRFSQQWLDLGLTDRPITRDISWGINIPEILDPTKQIQSPESKRIYVWFEAVIGYISASMEWARLQGTPDAWEDFWLNPEARSYYFLGKDNIPFHFIIFPAILMGYNQGKERPLILPHDIPANEYLQLSGEQFSKSRGHFITVQEFLQDYSTDALRYYLSVMMPENRDANFDLVEFITANNSELVGNLGNFIHRALSFTHKHFGQIPKPGALGELELQALEDMETHSREVFRLIEGCEFKRAIKEVMALSHKANIYFDRKAPWKDIKENREAAATTLYMSLQFSKTLSYCFYPFLPHAALRLWEYLGTREDWAAVKLKSATKPLPTGLKLQRPNPLFIKLEVPGKGAGEKGQQGKGKKNKKKKKKQVPVVIPEDLSFGDLDLRVATIESVEDHPSADKLYIFQLDLGEEKRQVIAGIKPYYQKEELLNRKVIMVCNLKPAKLRGEISNGMILAATSDNVVSVLTAPEAENGTRLSLLDRETGEIIPCQGKRENMDIEVFMHFVMKLGEIQQDPEIQLFVSEDLRFPIFDSHKLPENKTLVAMISPIKGLLVAADNYVSTEKSGLKPGSGIK